jgi:membrane-associated phospholipid phosphatase
MNRLAPAVVIAVVVFSGCSERPTMPNDAASRLSSTAAIQGGNTPAHPVAAVPASVTWEATAGALAASRSIAPIVAGRAYGLVGIAQYAAALAARPEGDDEQDADDDGASNASPSAHYYVIRGAVAGASAQVLRYLFPLDVAAIEAQVANEGAAGAPGIQKQFARGVALGRSLGDIVVQRGRADGFANANGTPRVWDPSTLPTGPTIWRMDADATPHVPSGFQFPAMRPYYLTSTDQFRPPPPTTDLTGPVNEVIAIVNARTPAQADISRFWNFTNGTVTALGYWDQQAAGYIQEFGLDELAAAHVFALMNSAASDAVLGCWEAKYHYLVLRPWMVAPGDLPNAKLIIGRPNHPSYPSGHSCVSSSAAAVLKEFFPSKAATLDQLVTEAGMSRIYAGIHYRMDIEQGQTLGRSVAAWAIAYDHEHGLLSAVFPSP